LAAALILGDAQMACRLTCLAVLLGIVAGCSTETQKGQLSGKVVFKGQPVPAGWISFMPDTTAGNRGAVKVAQIKDGTYNTALGAEPGISPGPTVIRIAGFDGKKEPFFPQGKQIFNPVELRETLPAVTSTKDFTVPASAANNLKVEPTADVP
jgi:hypothetical protein